MAQAQTILLLFMMASALIVPSLVLWEDSLSPGFRKSLICSLLIVWSIAASCGYAFAAIMAYQSGLSFFAGGMLFGSFMFLMLCGISCIGLKKSLHGAGYSQPPRSNG